MIVSRIAASESLAFRRFFICLLPLSQRHRNIAVGAGLLSPTGLCHKSTRRFSSGAFFIYTGALRLPQLSFRGAVGCPVFIERNHALGKRAAELKRLRPFAVGQKGKAMRKREMTIAGIPLQPIRRGKPAVIREANGCRQTTPVLWVDQLSSTEVTFETQNTVYHLRVMAVLRGKEAHRS